MRPKDGAGSDRVGDIRSTVQADVGANPGPQDIGLSAVTLPHGCLPAGRRQKLPAGALVCLPLTSATVTSLLHDVACDRRTAWIAGSCLDWGLPADLNWRRFCQAVQTRTSEPPSSPIWRILNDRLLRINVARTDAVALEQSNACHTTFLLHWREVAPTLVGDHQAMSLADHFAASLVTLAIASKEGDGWTLDVPSLTDLTTGWPPEIPATTRDALTRVVESFQDRWPDESEFAPVSMTSRTDAGETLPVTLEGLLQRVTKMERLTNHFDTELEQAKLGAMKELAYGASHEINNPLANISSRAQILLRTETDRSRRHALAAINRQAFRAHEMIADLMLFAKPPALKMEEKVAGELFQICVAEAHDALADEYPWVDDVPLETDWTRLADLVRADVVQLTVAVKAIWANALDCLEGSEGRVTIQSTRHAATEPNGVDWVEMSLHDTGPGIDARVRQHLFDPFFSGREAGRGLGFGLSKVWRIMELHGGRVSVQSDDGGTTIVLSLPVVARSEA